MNRRIKSFLTFTGGAVTGLIFGGAGVIAAGLSSERIREGLKKEIAERIDDKLFSEKKQKVSYSNCSTKDDTMLYMRTVYSLRVDAEKLLDEMKKIAATYGVVSVLDYYEIAGIQDESYEATKYGWNEHDICQGTIATIFDEYYVSLPRPKKLGV